MTGLVERKEVFGIYSDEIQELAEKIANVSKDLKRNENIFSVSFNMASKLNVNKNLVSYVENLAVLKARKVGLDVKVSFLKKEANDVVSFYIELV